MPFVKSSYRKQGINQINASVEGEFGVIYVDSLFINTTGRPATFRLGLEPTLTVKRQSSTPLSLTGFTCVNFSASGPAVLQNATLVNGQMYLFNNSSGFSQVNLSLDNNALVGGVLSLVIPAGQFVELLWDGVNLT
jgi:hypothetical protein